MSNVLSADVLCQFFFQWLVPYGAGLPVMLLLQEKRVVGYRDYHRECQDRIAEAFGGACMFSTLIAGIVAVLATDWLAAACILAGAFAGVCTSRLALAIERDNSSLPSWTETRIRQWTIASAWFAPIVAVVLCHHVLLALLVTVIAPIFLMRTAKYCRLLLRCLGLCISHVIESYGKILSWVVAQEPVVDEMFASGITWCTSKIARIRIAIDRMLLRILQTQKLLR